LDHFCEWSAGQQLWTVNDGTAELIGSPAAGTDAAVDWREIGNVAPAARG